MTYVNVYEQGTHRFLATIDVEDYNDLSEVDKYLDSLTERGIDFYTLEGIQQDYEDYEDYYYYDDDRYWYDD
jgi:hypothetical protein